MVLERRILVRIIPSIPFSSATPSSGNGGISYTEYGSRTLRKNGLKRRNVTIMTMGAFVIPCHLFDP